MFLPRKISTLYVLNLENFLKRIFPDHKKTYKYLEHPSHSPRFSILSLKTLLGTAVAH